MTSNCTPKLSPEDHIEIQQLYARNSYALDMGDGEARAATFTQDGTFAVYLTGHQPEPASVFGPRTTARGNRGVRHLMLNLMLEATPEGAKGLCYGLIVDGKHSPKTGFYEDRLVRTPKGWRFRVRELWLDTEEGSPYRAGAQSASAAKRDAPEASVPSGGD
jgi:hypothetical protein